MKFSASVENKLFVVWISEISRGTYWLSGAYVILFRVFLSFLFLSFCLIFVVDSTTC